MREVLARWTESIRIGSAGKAAAPVLAEKLDEHQMPQPGLWRWMNDADLGQIVAADARLAGDAPILLFIHGTFSRAEGAFGDLRLAPATTAEERWCGDAWNNLATAYGERIVAFQHRTLSLSPTQNAIDLLADLPVGARLHVVSHSRGGLIGDLLAQAQRTDGRPFAELDELKEQLGDHGPAYAAELALLEELGARLLEKKPRLERFVRIASPSAGTTLASGRLDRWLSVATNALDLTGLGASPTYRFVKGFLLAMAKTRADPASIPGLEAMLPGSLLIAALNRPGVTTAADLSVIAGDIEGGTLLGRLAMRVADWFYDGEHDLVVDTASMDGGLARTAGARRFFDHGVEVNHFSYFRNRSTVNKLVAGLRRTDSDEAGYAPLRPAPPSEFRIPSRRDGRPLPTVFVLPGITGSELAAGGQRVWLDLLQIARGRLGEINVERHGVTATAPIGKYYNALMTHLAVDHEVIPFAYDWRRTICEAGQLLAEHVAQRLEASPLPVRLVAHSLGGLVALMAFALRPKVWADFRERAGSRLLFLGTPYAGSFAIVRMLLAEEKLLTQLHMLDLTRNEEGILELIARMPGVLDLLPRGAAEDFTGGAVWKALRQTKRRGWVDPAAPDLASAAETFALIAEAPIDPERMAYVAGQADATPVALEIEDGRRVRFMATTRGDGRVPWETGIPKALRQVFFADAVHGDLSAHEPAFAAYSEILATGTTTRLRTTAPPTGRAASDRFELLPDTPTIFPDEDDLRASALGASRRPKRKAVRQPVRVKVVHGNLAFARYPVVVGHYEGDVIAGSEAHLDRALSGRLSQRRDLDLYPGPIETAEVILDPLALPDGAVVVGMGKVGDLTPGGLRRTLATGLRRYVLAAHEAGRTFPPGLSILLVGAGEGGIGIRAAIRATLEAVQDLQRAAAPDVFGLDVLSEIELVELYDDRAIQAAHALVSVVKAEAALQAAFVAEPEVARGEGGISRAFAEEDANWWRRLKIETNRTDGSLRFTDLTDRARADESLLVGQRLLVDRFISRAVARPTTAVEDVPDPARTLFELLLPVHIKEQAKSDRNLVLILDQEAAAYPWELLHDGPRPQKQEQAQEQGPGRPLAVRAGLLRQLAEDFYPVRPLVASSRQILVVGDPPSPFAPLDGAVAEAKAVTQAFRRAGFVVTPCIRGEAGAGQGGIERYYPADPETILGFLMPGGWQVLHLAAHGVVDYETAQGRVTGMVLGEGVFLPPGVIANLSDVPELVFVNCCHLGAVSAAAESTAATRYHELAANLATQFIKLGCRAVVAAGWAVNDVAASLFADVFYSQLLDGRTFGEALQTARATIYERYPLTNTWGAYQAYGDPGYRLVRDAGAAWRSDSQRLAAPREAIFALDAIRQDAQTMAVRDPVELRKRLEDVLAALPAKWTADAEVLTAIAEARAELGDVAGAIAAYEQALAAARASAPLRAIEQLANLRARQAIELNPAAAPAAIRKEQAVLRRLKRLSGGGDTVERLCLLGSCEKRLAQVSSGDARMTALRQMGKHYRAAHELAQKGGRLDTYPLLNWLLAEALAAVLENKAPPAELIPWLDRAEAEVLLSDRAEPRFWTLVALGDVALGRHLLANDLGGADRQNEVAAAYLRAWKRGASRLKFSSVLENLRFVAATLNGLAPATDLQAALVAIATRLAAETGVEPPAWTMAAGAVGTAAGPPGPAPPAKPKRQRSSRKPK